MKKTFVVFAVVAAMFLQGCSRVETGEVGLRIGFDKQVSPTELMPGSFNQHIVGEVLTFPVREIAMNLDNIHPQTKDNSTIADMDITVIYSINPSAVSELYTTRSKAFHAVATNGEWMLMYNYLSTVANSAAFKAVAKHEALKTITARGEIESELAALVTQALKDEKLDTALTITKVQVRNIQPARTIIDSANEAISAQNQLLTATTKVKVAEQEAARQTLLSRPANLEYMKVQAALNVSEGVRDGKVQTILIPHSLTMYGGAK